MTTQQITQVKNSWNLLQKIEPVIIGDAFYGKLFLEAPQVRPMFKSSRTEQAKKLMGTLAVVVNHLDKLDTLTHAIRQLAMRHVEYGVQPAHYDLVGKVLIWTLEKMLKENWNSALAGSWNKCYAILAETMIHATSDQI